jgi:hypothetical protein
MRLPSHPFVFWFTCTLASMCAPAGATGYAASVNYRWHCSGCHLVDGAGMPDHGIPALRNVIGRFLRVPEGRSYLVQVPGVSNTPLSDAETADLMNWLIRSMAGPSLPDDFVPYSAGEVGRLRRTRPADPAAKRVGILRRLDQQDTSAESH